MSKYGKYIVNELKTTRFSPEFAAKYAKWATRILWMDEKVVDGAFQMNCAWYMRVPTEDMPSNHAHTHESSEIIGFFGSNPQEPYDLGGEIELWIDDEQHMITRSSLVFVPSGLKHCPLIVRRVDRPIFHFSTLTEGQYIMRDYEEFPE